MDSGIRHCYSLSNMRTFTATLVLLGLVVLVTAEEDPYLARASNHPGIAGPCSAYVSTPDLRAAVADEGVCTVVLVGASWDGHYKAYRSSEYWLHLTNELCSEEFTFVYSYYSGFRDAFELPDIADDWRHGTIGSYEIRAFRGGRDLGRSEVAMRRAPPAEVAEELHRLCGSGGEGRAARSGLQPAGASAASLLVVGE